MKDVLSSCQRAIFHDIHATGPERFSTDTRAISICFSRIRSCLGILRSAAALFVRFVSMSRHEAIKIRIVIPAYNSELCLRETLDSVLAQTAPAHEIIVVDDGSKDKTAEIALSYGERIRYIKQANKGIAGARNTGIENATGNWIAFLDHDDLMLPTKLERQTAVAASNHELVAVYSTFTYLYSDGSTKPVPVFPAKDLWPALRYRSPILPSTVMIRRTALIEIGGFRKFYTTDDWDLWFRLVRRYSPRNLLKK
jgi:glycosyltransferase involved in cell wall biosynthesis